MENENTNEKKKQIRLAIIGVVALLLLTLGATFAYFLIDTDNGTSKSNIKGDISKAGVATLIPGTGNLHINLKAEDMSEANQGTEYYGDDLESNPYVLSEEEGTHTISQVQITDGEETTKYSCTAKVVVTMEIAEDNNMGSVLEPGDLILQFKGNIISEKLDLSEIKESGTKEFDLSFKLTGNTMEDIQAYIKLINREDNQNYLASKNLKVDIKTEELSCDIFTPNTKLIAELREKTNCLTEDLVNGLYRCQGNSIVTLDESGYNIETRQDTVNNNYICLGSDCSSAESNDMYRIIGINEDGEMKVIKNIPDSEWNSTLYSSSIDENYWTDYSWLNSEVIEHQYHNENAFLSFIPLDLKSKIIETTWNYGKVDLYSIEEDEEINALRRRAFGDIEVDEKERYALEIAKLFSRKTLELETKNANKKTAAKIGLINAIDYCNSFESNGDKYCVGESILTDSLYYGTGERLPYFAISWLTPTTTGGYADASIDDGYGIDNEGFTSSGDVLRPVFFLTSDIELSGEGTIETPFTIGISGTYNGGN